MTVRFWFSHSVQIETRLCGENVRQGALVTLVSGGLGTRPAWLGLGPSPTAPCSFLRAPSFCPVPEALLDK